jgi:redox-sensitive bicupin YhaK (pirin superfamily)
MLCIRRSQDRGHFNHGWLDTYHTFSFGDYYDPQQMAFRSLRVMNEDHVQPGQGFGMHGHRDMEIVTYVLAGALEHRDSLGNGSVLRPGELQRMTAGSGIRHSEFNPSASEPVHLYQIWLLPERKGLEPSYDQRPFPVAGRRGMWQLAASPDGRDGSLAIRQDAEIYLAELAPGQALDFGLKSGRHAWLQTLRGEVRLNGQSLAAGDGAAISEESSLSVRADGDAEVMLFNLA